MNKYPESSELKDAGWLSAIMNMPVLRAEEYQEIRDKKRETRRQLEDLHDQSQQTRDLW
ncbi:hypothetical protein [Chitinimonas sp. BJYL2]|uniref:hypothetical protein n=1 Tax=Chitinimonas sp. BJYL2 TaxID=2976696 RepID=UPI0022B376C9|nr:hypothetical protein [Chitinimonas sp. BJYL2]